jgi:hypothetical protein
LNDPDVIQGIELDVTSQNGGYAWIGLQSYYFPRSSHTPRSQQGVISHVRANVKKGHSLFELGIDPLQNRTLMYAKQEIVLARIIQTDQQSVTTNSPFHKTRPQMSEIVKTEVRCSLKRAWSGGTLEPQAEFA